MRAAPATATGVMKALAASPRCIFGCNCFSAPLPSRKQDFDGPGTGLPWSSRGRFVVTLWSDDGPPTVTRRDRHGARGRRPATGVSREQPPAATRLPLDSSAGYDHRLHHHLRRCSPRPPQRDATQLIGGLKQRKRWRAAIEGERADRAASGAPQPLKQIYFSWSWKLDDLPGTF